jgi:hypothetical protein
VQAVYFLFFGAKEAVEVIKVSDVIMSVEIIEATEVFRTTYVPEINKLMARISFFLCFEFLFDRMMEFQVKFCNPLELRVWRTGIYVTFNQIEES